jgi:hypothetical protein
MKLGSVAFLTMLSIAGSAPRASAGVGQDDVQALLDLHDTERCAVDPPAASMPAMSWNPLLATVAQAYAEGCVIEHNTNRSQDYAAVGGSGYVGENIAWGMGYSLIALAQLWATEKAAWTFAEIDASTVSATGHYTQMIWADTTTIGCGAAACNGTTFLVCDYSPGGNYIGQTPYSAGSGTNEACHAPEPTQSLAFGSALLALATLRARKLRVTR